MENFSDQLEDMPSENDQWQIKRNIENVAIPDLQKLVDKPHLLERSLRRFDRDVPPRRASSSEDESGDEEYAVYIYDCPRMLGVDRNALLENLNQTLEKPLNSFEQTSLAYSLCDQYCTYNPRTRYQKEAEVEYDRLDRFAWFSSDGAKDYLLTKPLRAGEERMNVIVRRNIKRRWQKLGVWNPAWGIPGRLSNPQANDDLTKWKWAWEHDDSTEFTEQHPIRRAVHLRGDLRRGEHKQVDPQSSLQEDASASQAEAFITTRPWFLYDMDQAEEDKRLGRLSAPQQTWFDRPKKYVNEQWKLRGDQRVDWQDRHGYFCPGWKWGHESPCPEPEDLTPLKTMDMDFTPSEVDALEAIPPPTPGRHPDSLPLHHPYMQHVHKPFKLLRGFTSSPESSPNLDEEPPKSPESEKSTESQKSSESEKPPESEASTEPEQSAESEKSPEPEQRPLPNRRRRQIRDESQAPPRRSERIAAMKANQSGLPLKSSASSPLDTRARNKLKRGRPRKVDSPVLSEATVRSKRGGKRK